MSKTIWKFRLNISDQMILMPKGAEILCLQTQHEQPYLWVLVDPKEKTDEGRFFMTQATGEAFDSQIDRKYIGTYQLSGGTLVFHVFEIL